MDPIEACYRKEFVACMVEVLGTAIRREQLDDAETVLQAVRHLRPNMSELDTFDAWISIRRLDWLQAMRVIRGAGDRVAEWPLGKALLAFCQFATGDRTWMQTAEEVLDYSDSEDAKGLMRLLMGKEEPPPPSEAESTPALVASDTAEASDSEQFKESYDWRAMRA